ncbi:MAG: acetyl-CoA carboxylase biotin carboxyl carrier protein subunit [Burkholderiales bacterium]
MALLRIKCEVAGKVVRIEAAAGANVAQDDAILIVESMKMEIPLSAPAAGTVEAVLVAEGDDVAEDQEAALLRTGESR